MTKIAHPQQIFNENRHNRRRWAVLDRRIAQLWAAQKRVWADGGCRGAGPALHCDPNTGYRIERRNGQSDVTLPLLRIVAESLPTPAPGEVDARRIIREGRAFEATTGPPPQKESPRLTPGANGNFNSPSTENSRVSKKSQHKFLGALPLAQAQRQPADLARKNQRRILAGSARGPP
jgi:hypothetical protein